MDDPFSKPHMGLMRRQTMAPISTRNKDMGKLTGFDEKKVKLKSDIRQEIRSVLEEIESSRE